MSQSAIRFLPIYPRGQQSYDSREEDAQPRKRKDYEAAYDRQREREGKDYF